MRMLVTTAAVMAALTLSAFAEGESTDTEAVGEAQGSFRMSAQHPAEPILQGSLGERAMAQASLPSEQIKSPKASKAKSLKKSKHLKSGASSNASAANASARGDADNFPGYAADALKSPTGMDGGNRK